MPTSDQLLQNGRIGNSLSGPLPAELLAEIFHFCAPLDRERLFVPPCLLAPLTLSWVCRYWRKICLATPRLWTDIVLGFYDHQIEREIPLLDLWLSRGGTLPITFKHIAELDDHLHVLLQDDSTQAYAAGMHIILEKICARAGQLRVLVLNVLDVGAAFPVLSMVQQPLGPSLTAAFPLLEELCIQSIHLGQAGECLMLQNLDVACPMLQRISLLTPPMAPPPHVLPLQHVRHLDLKFCTSIDNCMRWLDACPALETLSVRLFRSTIEHEPFEEQEEDGWVLLNTPRQSQSRALAQRNIRNLGRLVRLDVRGFSSSADVSVLLDMVDAPSLRELELSTFAHTTAETERVSVLKFLRRSQPPLELLQLSGTPMKAADIIQCLQVLPRLKTLGIVRLKDADALFRALTITVPVRSPAPSSQLLCAGLEVLDIANSEFSVDTIASLVSSRYSWSPPAEAVGVEGSAPLVTNLKELHLDGHHAASLQMHPSIIDCISQGLVLTRDQSDSLLNFRLV